MAFPTIDVRVKDTVVTVKLCWPADKVEAMRKRHDDGIVDIDYIDSKEYKGPANNVELEWLRTIATDLADKKLKREALAKTGKAIAVKKLLVDGGEV